MVNQKSSIGNHRFVSMRNKYTLTLYTSPFYKPVSGVKMISGSGIIFITTNNPLAKVFRALFNFPYDTIGYYYNSSIGMSQYVMLNDVWSFDSPRTTFTWATFLASTSIITRMDFFPVWKEENFKQILTQTVNDYDTITSEEWVAKWINGPLYAIEILNKFLSVYFGHPTVIDDLRKISSGHRIEFFPTENIFYTTDVSCGEKEFIGAIFSTLLGMTLSNPDTILEIFYKSLHRQNNFVQSLISESKGHLALTNELKSVVESFIGNRKINSGSLEQFGIKCPNRDTYAVIRYDGPDPDPEIKTPMEDIYEQIKTFISDINDHQEGNKCLSFSLSRLLQNLNSLFRTNFTIPDVKTRCIVHTGPLPPDDQLDIEYIQDISTVSDPEQLASIKHWVDEKLVLLSRMKADLNKKFHPGGTGEIDTGY